MAYNYEYPYTDAQRYNDDWLINKVKELAMDWLKTSGEWTETQEAWEELKRYITDYFNNLDVQEEINEKLEAMKADGSLFNIIKPLFGEYQQAIDVLSARVDTFTALGDDATTGDAELADIRVDYTGHTWPNAGDAIREVTRELSNEIDCISNILDITETYVAQPYDTYKMGYIYENSTTVTENSGYVTKFYNGIIGGQKYYVSTLIEILETGVVHWFASDGSAISYVKSETSGLKIDYEVKAPSDAVSCAIVGKITESYNALANIALKIIRKSSGNIDTKRLALHVDENKNIVIASKYTSSKDIWLSLTKNGASALPQIGKVFLKDNANNYVSSDFTEIPTPLYSPSSDWISPYGSLYAVNNSDTDISTSFYWCGGWHGTDGGNGGYATAKLLDYRIFADNIEIIESGTYLADEVKAIVKNGICAINTVKSDGTGRHVVEETITYTFKAAGKIDIDCKIEVKENVNLEHYYGIQCEFMSTWNGGQLNVNDNVNLGWFANANSYIGGSTKTDSVINNFIVRDNAKENFVECYMLPMYGMTDRKYLVDTVPTAFTNNYNKSYFNLVDSIKTFSEGMVLCWRGGYRFYNAY